MRKKLFLMLPIPNGLKMNRNKKTNKPINILNLTSIWSLIIGTILILTFVSINLFAMNDNQKPRPSDSPRQQPKPLTEEKRGRTNPPPPRTNPTSTPKK